MARDEEFFLRNVFPEHFPFPLEDFHRDILGVVEDGHPFCAFKVPRKHGKTTLLSFGHPMYKIAFRRTRFTILISDVEGQASLNLETLKDAITGSERFIHYFGRLQNPLKWNETEIELLNGIKVMAKGTFQRIRGLKWGPYRPDLYVVDDFESEHNTETKDLRDKVRRWIMGPLLGSVEDTAQIILSGTVVHPEAWLATVEEEPDWTVRNYTILKADGTPLWANKYSQEKIDSLRRMHERAGTLDVFYREYFNEARNPESQRLLEHGQAKFYDPKRVVRKWGGTYLTSDKCSPVPLFVCTGVDPALGRRTSNDTALITIGIDPDWNVYLLNAALRRLNVNETMEQIFAIQEFIKPRIFGIEDVGYQEALMTLVEQGSLQRGLFPLMEGIPTHGERKQMRIMSMQPRFKAGTIYFREGNSTDQRIIDQAMAFDPERKENRDDGLDGLWLALQVAEKPNKVAFVNGEPHVPIREKPPSWAVL